MILKETKFFSFSCFVPIINILYDEVILSLYPGLVVLSLILKTAVTSSF